MSELIGVMSKRSDSLAAAGDAGRFECNINPVDFSDLPRSCAEGDLFVNQFGFSCISDQPLVSGGAVCSLTGRLEARCW